MTATRTDSVQLRQDWSDASQVVLLRGLRNRRFKLRYEYDPVAFAHDCIDWPDGRSLTFYQEEVLAAVPVEERVAVRGPHGLGKTAMASIFLLWFALTRDGDDWKMPTTASVWRQLSKFLWPEVHKWTRMVRWDKVGREAFNPRNELLMLQLQLETGSAFAVASDDPSAIEGAHADRLAYLFDESKAIRDGTFDAAEGAFSGAGEDTGYEAYALAISTPGAPAGRFYDIHSRRHGFEHWHVRHVTLDEAMKAGRIAVRWAMQMEKQWGADSAVFKQRVLGEFASDDEYGVIPLQWVEAAVHRWHEWKDAGGQVGNELTTLGADIADSGSDECALAWRFGDVIAEVKTFPNDDPATMAGRIEPVIAQYGGRAIIDSIGVGSGTFRILQQRDVPCDAFVASEGTDETDLSGTIGFINRRAAAWWHMRELLDPSNGHEIALPPDTRLIGDLSAPKYVHMAGAKIKIESKEDIKKRIGRSTDVGDAVVMAFYGRGGGRRKIRRVLRV